MTVRRPSFHWPKQKRTGGGCVSPGYEAIVSAEVIAESKSVGAREVGENRYPMIFVKNRSSCTYSQYHV